MSTKRLSVVIDADTSGFQRSVKGMQGSMKGATSGISKTLGKMGGAVKNTVGAIGKIAGAVGVFKLVNGAINMITASFDSAISRVDTLNQFPKVLSLMGYEAEDAERATKKLAEGIQGLPTRLDEVTGTTQRMVNIFQDVDKATDSTLALNNAFLASGSSQDQANRGLEQYIQMLSKGSVDMQSWRTLQETMPYALQKTAEAFGFTGRSAQQDFYKALQDGDITMDQFNDKIIELSNAQGGFAEVALESTKGIRTSWTNIKTAITNGVATAITAFNDWLKSAGFGEIHDVLDGIKDRVGEVFKTVADYIPRVMDFFMNLFNTITSSKAFNILRDEITRVVSEVTENLPKVINFFVDLFNKVRESTAFNTLIEVIGRAISKFNEIREVAITKFLESSAWEAFKNILGEIVDAILEIDFTEIIRQIGEFVDRWSPLIAGVLGAVGAFKAIMGVLALVASVKATLITIAGGLTTAVGLLGGAIAFLMSPIGLVVVAIGALIAIGVLLYKNWDEIKAKASEIWGSIKEFFISIHESIQGAFQTAWEGIKNFFISIHESIQGAFQNAWEGIKDFFIGLHESIQSTVQSIWNAVANFFRGIWESIVSTARAIWEPIKSFFSTLWEGVKAVFEVIWNAIKTVLIVIMGLIMIAIADTWNAIADIINGVLNVIRTVVTTVWNAIKGHVETIVNGIKTVITTVWNTIKTVVTTVTNAIRTVITTVWNTIRTVTSTVWTSIQNVITTVVNAIRNIVTTIWNAIRTTTTTVFNAIRNVATTVWNGIRTAITTVVNAIRTVVTTVWNAILSVLTTIMNSIRTTTSTIWNGIRTTISTIVSGIRSTVTNTFNGLKSTVTNIWNNIKNSIERPIKQARDTVRNMINQMKGFFNFQWKLPKLKMPRFSVSGSPNPINWLTQGVPKINVDWFATGGIATGASVVGIGEKGSEAIVPLSQKHRMKPFAEAVASMMPQDNNDSGGSKGETIITGNTFVVREEADIKKIAQELKKLDDRESRAKGKKGAGN